jgi:hypothetical protein
MTEKEEAAYIAGGNAAWAFILSEAMRNLGGADLTAAHLISERHDVVVALRSICEDYGDNDWEDNLHLADVIEKHLRPHLKELL